MFFNFFDQFKGMRTKIAAVSTILIVGLYAFGIIDKSVFEASATFFGAIGLFCLRLALDK